VERPWTLGAAAALGALENVAVLAGLLFAGSAPVMVLLVVLGKFPLCARLLRLSLGAVVILILWESFTLVVALVNTSLTLPGQVALFASAMTTSTLLALSVPLFAPEPPST
jgi:hypothetical protein